MTTPVAKRLSWDKVDRIIRDLESKHRLLEYKLGRWSVWIILRWVVAMRLSNLGFGRQPVTRRWRLLGFALQDLISLTRLRRSDFLIESYSSALMDHQAERYKDVWFDDLIDHLGVVTKVEILNSPMFLERRKSALNPSQITTTLIRALSYLLARLIPRPAVRKLADRFHTILVQELAELAPERADVMLQLGMFDWSRRYWRWLLKRLAPRAVLVADAGDHALAAAAKECSVPVIEFQHGIIDLYNPAYSLSRAAASSRESLPVSDFLFLHGEYWKEVLDHHGFWNDRVRVTGNTRVDAFRRRREPYDPSRPFQLVFTSQGFARREAALFFQTFLQYVPKTLALKLIIKLHPVYDTDKSGYLDAISRDGRVAVLRAEEGLSIFELLADSDLHLSISSATHYDALALGVSTVVVALENHEIMRPLVDAGHAGIVSSPQELADLIQGYMENRQVPAGIRLGPEISALYCRPGAVENTLREMCRLGILSRT